MLCACIFPCSIAIIHTHHILILRLSLPPSLQGMALFQRRQQEVASLSEQDNLRRKRSLSMLKDVQQDHTLSPDDKILFAETLREVRRGHVTVT